VDLSFRDFGGRGRPILMLHGLFGSSQNWSSEARRLSSRGRSYALDLRNHGDSPHDPSHSLADCVEDVWEWAGRHVEGPMALLGHSMGGLVAMGFAIEHPQAVEKLLVEDVAPRSYPLDHEKEFEALSTDVGACRSRAELDVLLAPIVPDRRTREFLLTNAVRHGAGFRWRLNVQALKTASLFGDFSRLRGSYEGETLFLVGGRSDSVSSSDYPGIYARFPRARIVEIAGGDHWIHASARREFDSVLDSFF
jgi:esterase